MSVDKEQTHESIKSILWKKLTRYWMPLMKKMHKLCEELGDLLLQITFHARIAEEEGRFNINDVIREIIEKMVRRHPHVFGSASAQTPNRY